MRLGNCCCVGVAKQTLVDNEIFCQPGGGEAFVLQIKGKSWASISWLSGRQRHWYDRTNFPVVFMMHLEYFIRGLVTVYLFFAESVSDASFIIMLPLPLWSFALQRLEKTISELPGINYTGHVHGIENTYSMNNDNRCIHWFWLRSFQETRNSTNPTAYKHCEIVLEGTQITWGFPTHNF